MRVGEILKGFVKVSGWDMVKEAQQNVREQMEEDKAPVLEEFPNILKLVYLYPTPIKKETKVLEAIVFDRTSEDENGDYQMIAEDGEVYTDTLDCVAGANKDEVQRILDELREDMIASGEIE